MRADANARAAIMKGVPQAVQPTGRPITMAMLRGTGPVLIDEPYPELIARFSAFMNSEQPRGALFHFTTVYSWKVELNKLHTMHVKFEPAVWTLDGCQAVDQFTVEYLQVEPIDITPRRPLALATQAPPPFQLHGPGKRR
jgi:hypothetical protein